MRKITVTREQANAPLKETFDVRIARLEDVLTDLQSREAERDPQYKPVVDLTKKVKESG